MSNVEKINRPPMPAAPKLEVSPSFEAHPLAALMPMMDDDAFANLKADIAKRGIEHPMTTYQGLLLDGRNRYRAAKELGLTLTPSNFKEFAGAPSEAEAFVISANVHRRQLNNKQKQEFAQKMIARYPQESDRALSRMTSLSKTTIASARTALAHSPEKRKFDAAVKAWDGLSDQQQIDLVLMFERDIRDILATEAAELTS
jgi:ParB-like chromosome segregation protein Spo0J